MKGEFPVIAGKMYAPIAVLLIFAELSPVTIWHGMARASVSSLWAMEDSSKAHLFAAIS